MTTGIFSSTVEYDNTTIPETEGPEVWSMPFAATIVTVVYLALNAIVGLSANCLLIIIINHSPTLKTPANSHLINICANNLVLCLCMVLSLLSILLPLDLRNKINILTGFHVFLISNCLFQYWGTFASIGYYRSKIIKSPSMSIRRRRQIITRCLATSWATSLLVSLMVCLSHIEHDVFACMTLNPFQNEFLICGNERKYSAQRLGIVVISILVFFIMLVIVVTSYQKVFKALNKGNPFCKNRIAPVSRSISLPSEVTDDTSANPQSNQVCGIQNGQSDKAVYTISRKDIKTESDIVVHYQRNDSITMLTFEDIIALENPILATHMRRQILQRRPLQLTRSTASNNSVKSKGQDFTDISASADLQRFQNFKNNSALRNYFLRRDRAGFNSATRNSLVMLASFVVCSLPMFVCTIPHVLSQTKESHRVLILLFTKLAFYLNAPIYPLWYLVQNKRVRKCLFRVFDSICLKLDMRH
ncbi:uncharacterized protein LOC123534856 [Mercenaria mercenaria]|uniref:uncharacterized protein LOC123534856 n=1 Tax=Mercenaria mercenaria TaxID=6596 RepID=UPI00234F67C6|nr:uncharacterized protein LOC123534856 [Mercenaria mercenaria]